MIGCLDCCRAREDHRQAAVDLVPAESRGDAQQQVRGDMDDCKADLAAHEVHRQHTRCQAEVCQGCVLPPSAYSQMCNLFLS